ncbi:MAG: hypothetical protein GY700_06355 [Propionibacteriaceae bacterium]|nr:hypothetical protein [Propionibacteriaceae bacterium]
MKKRTGIFLLVLALVIGVTSGVLAYDKDSKLSSCLVDPTCDFETIVDTVTDDTSIGFTFGGTTWDLDPTGAYTCDMDAAMDFTVTVSDDNVDAFEVQEATSTYIAVRTSNGNEEVILSTGDLVFTGVDMNLDPTGDVDLAMDNGKDITIVLDDGQAEALKITDGTSVHFEINTTGTPNTIELGNAVDNNNTTFLGTGIVEIDGELEADGAIDADAGMTLSGGALTFDGTNLNFDPTGTYALDMDNNQTVTITADDGLAAAFVVSDGTDTHLEINTTGTPNTIDFGSANDNNNFFFLGTGIVEIDGELEQDGTADFDGTVDFGAAVTCSYAGNCLTSGTTADLEWLGFASFGNGTPDAVTDGTAEDVYIEGGLEVDGWTAMQGPWNWDNMSTHTAAYAPAAATTDGILLVNGAAGGWTYAYPEEDCDAAADVGRIIIVKCNASGATGCSARNIAITPETATIDGAATYTLSADYQSVTLLCAGVNVLHVI